MNGLVNRLEGRVALITGGASGIGWAIANRYAREGGKVVLADIDAELLKEAKAQLGSSCATVEANVMVESDMERAVAVAVKHFGRLDIGVNNAGVGTYAVITDQTEEQWDTVIDVCLKGAFFSIKHEARQMISQGGGGVIINISSLNSTQPGEGMSAYCSAKAGVNMLTRVAAMDLGPHRIRVCCIAPGLIDTHATAGVREMPQILDAFLENIPLGRSGKTEDVANAAMFLASDEASWISGETLFVDGASSTKRYPELNKLFGAM